MNKKTIFSPKVTAPGVPLSPAVVFKDLVFVSGQPGYKGDFELAKDDFGAQMRQSMDNLKALLEEAGSSMEKVLKVTVIVTKQEFFAEMNEIYKSYFKHQNYPARTTIVAGFGDPDFLVEVECIAHK